MDYFIVGIVYVVGCLLSFAGGMLLAKNMLEVVVS